MLACLRCQGEKIIHSPGFTSLEGKVYPDRTYSCSSCDGEGFFTPPNVAALAQRITAGQGKNKGKLRAAFPAPYGKNVEESRAYYVWRLARFHGGKDMTMPMTADLITRGDPYKKQLDLLAEKVARISFGTDMAAAQAWSKALYGE